MSSKSFCGLDSMEAKPNPLASSPSSVQLRKMKDLYKFFNIVEKIGSGTYGTVYKAEDVRTKELRALKIGEKFENARKLKFYQEIKILRMISHKNIIKLDKVYESRNKICLVLEYCPRELAQIFLIKKKLIEWDVRTIMTYLSSAVSYLHDKGIVHRDLKLENILLGMNPENPKDIWFVKLTDFGLSAVRGGTGFHTMFNALCGTLRYIAPEMATKSYSQKCDIWSMGIIMFLLLEGVFPFDIDDEETALEKIRNTNIDFKSLKCTEEATDLIAMCLHKNPALRISAGEILLHPFIAVNRSTAHPLKRHNVITMMDEYNNRISMNGVKVVDSCNEKKEIVYQSSEENESDFNINRNRHNLPTHSMPGTTGTAGTLYPSSSDDDS